MSEFSVTRLEGPAIGRAARLLDAYRQFYGQPSDADAADRFLRERAEANDSVVFAAEAAGEPVGFVQLYPSFSSVAMRRVWILNDLFVAEDHRQRGVAKALMTAAAGFAQQTGAARLVLATGVDNTAAKRLYEQNGWQRDNAFDHYLLPV